MPSAAGLLLSSVLGAAARRLQVQIVGKQYSRSWSRLPGYALSMGAFVGGYLVCDHFIDRNRYLLSRRLEQLREQRAQSDAFHLEDLTKEHRITAEMRGSAFSGLIDKYGKNYK